MAANPDVLAYLIDGAKRRGIDPNLVVKAFNHEGLSVFDPNKPDRGGDEGSSFGPYQLHYAGMSRSMPNAGMGDDFTRKTGLNARDPSTWRQQTDYVLDHLASGGTWDPWMGAKAEGITGRMGLPGGSAAPATHAASVASPQAATDAAGPSQQPTQPTQTPLPAPGQPGGAMGPPNPPGWTPGTTWQPPSRSDLAGQMLAGLKGTLGNVGTAMTASAQNQPSLAGLAPPKASRVDSPEIATIDPQQAQIQQQRMALALQRLNSGRLV
jgi:hypothetical protein